MQFIKSYIKSMRLYYCFVTLTAGAVGISMFNGAAVADKAVLGLILFFSWGVNQIINDYLNIEEDKINAPQRPMVSGALNPKGALMVSACAISFIIIYSIYKNPAAVIPAAAGVVLNILYSKFKGYGLLGCVFFGLSISCCAWFAYVLLGGNLFMDAARWQMFSILVIFNMVMTYFTYFKDIAGDAAAGKRTLPVRLGAKKAGKLGMLLSFIPGAILFLLLIVITTYTQNIYFCILTPVAAGIFILTGFLFLKNSAGSKTYYNLKYNFAALCACQSALVCASRPLEGFILGVVSVLGVLIIFTRGYQNAAE
ncbi:geranylgeranylglycerol-phosphate geranylgeranyltransferase [Elusimicrobium posterum]|uniref:UbiA prenyltransferase family protein n=1 Tax=Elusimicrobium posterum TaxID=3116653 RepID=UPI003C735C86